jgi:hypothetical protein
MLVMRFAVFFLALAACGCGSHTAPTNEFIPVTELAPELRKVAEKTLPDVKFESARKKIVKGEEVFEIRGKQPNGKIREVELNAAGTVIEVE